MNKIKCIDYINNNPEIPKAIGKTVYIFRNVNKDELHNIFIKNKQSGGLWSSNYNNPKTSINNFKLVAKSKRYNIFFNNDKKKISLNNDLDLDILKRNKKQLKIAALKYTQWTLKGLYNQNEYKLNIFNSHFVEVNRYLKKNSIIDILDNNGNSILYMYKAITEMLHIKDMQTFLNEGSYTFKDLPKFFYRSLDFQFGDVLISSNTLSKISLDAFISDLNKGIIKGIKGISADTLVKSAIAKDAFLRFNANDFEKINKLSLVLYDNIYYLSDKNFKVLKRISGYQNDIWLEAINNLKNHLNNYKNNRFYNNEKLKNIKDLVEKLNSNKSAIIKFLEKGFFRNFPDMINKVLKFLQQININTKFNLLASVFETIIINYVKEFTPEKEWLIKTPFIKVPKSTVLYIKIDDIENKYMNYEYSYDNDIEDLHSKDIPIDYLKEKLKLKIKLINNWKEMLTDK